MPTRITPTPPVATVAPAVSPTAVPALDDADLSGLVPLNEANALARLPRVSKATLARWARELPIGAVRIAGRWYCDPVRLRAVVVGRQQGGSRP